MVSTKEAKEMLDTDEKLLDLPWDDIAAARAACSRKDITEVLYRIFIRTEGGQTRFLNVSWDSHQTPSKIPSVLFLAPTSAANPLLSEEEVRRVIRNRESPISP